jgi:hypothetical protein
VRAAVLRAIAHGIIDGLIRNDIPAPRLARLVEDAVLAGLAEATREHLDGPTAHRLVMLLALGTVGFSAHEAADIIDNHPELEWTAR